MRWRLSGRAELLAQARVLGRCLWMPTTTSEAVLLEPRDGRELARIPAAADEAPALAASTLAVRRADGRVAVWDLANGRLIGRSTEPATAIALRSDGLLALDERRRPTVIDIASGGVRRVLAEAPVELTALGRDLAFVILAGAEHRSLIAFSLDGLVQRWAVELPPGIEVEALRPAAAGVLAILREGTRTWGLSLDERGQPLSFAGWVSESGGDATPLRHGALVVEAQALRVLRPGLPAPQPPLRCTVLDAAKPLREAAAAAKPAWSRPDGAAVAVARHGLLLVIAVRTADTEHVLRIGDGGSGTSLDAVRAMIAPGGLRLAIPGSWTLSEQWITAEASGPVIWSAWAPLPSRASGTPLAVLLNEHAGMPWWLSAGWQQVTDPP